MPNEVKENKKTNTADENTTGANIGEIMYLNLSIKLAPSNSLASSKSLLIFRQYGPTILITTDIL